ncbi:ribonuclease P/MRP protein subunit POP5 [Halohasta litchfieldiae]|jgi:ribonuclease P/MRP protein subunit POP5|uniref:Ribonuclease P protein component 2 n=1 Tax=Halohasta litchfieldiae TaxID=1073996 RepID=A0A1H6RKJ8_9EURY|nr:Rpp14/Pop5 family protein [Halohasta litchfieldiae]ATW89812.1 ribonuclease P/MRP protein subunit POP5 [Halohasta litchfieldiae]SEI52330.1 ribonuclease P/MRP protein subunit POP5 [Halohasta litchfieldiae]
MKHLPKHIRPRWRYLAVDIESTPDAKIDRGTFQRELWYAAGNLLGDPGSADADLTVYDFRFEDGVGETIIRVRRGETDAARAAVACVDAIDGEPVGVVVRGISGTVRACEESYLGRRTGDFEQRHVVFADARRAAVSRGEAVEVSMPRGLVSATELDFE